MAGIYIHIPFCKSRCKYCDFFSTTDLEKRSQYVDALLCEWQDAELTGNKIVHLVGTNRTYIQQAAKQLGFANLSDMLNRRRIDYMCQQLRKDPNTSVQTLFVDEGYRSRTTAWRHFTSIVGCTPS